MSLDHLCDCKQCRSLSGVCCLLILPRSYLSALDCHKESVLNTTSCKTVNNYRSCGSVTQACLTLCDPMDCSIPGLPVLHHLPEFVQTHVHWDGDAIQPSCPLLSPSPALNLSQHQGLFKWVGSSYRWPKYRSFQLQHQSFQWTPRTDLLQNGLVGSPCSPRDSQESSPAPQFESINSSALSLLYGSTIISIDDYWKTIALTILLKTWFLNRKKKYQVAWDTPSQFCHVVIAIVLDWLKIWY